MSLRGPTVRLTSFPSFRSISSAQRSIQSPFKLDNRSQSLQIRNTMSSSTTSTSASAAVNGTSDIRTRWETERSARVSAELKQGVDVWTLFNPVVFPTAINLGQGFMNWSPPNYILDTLKDDMLSRVDLHHYSHPKGRPRLRDAISAFYSDSFCLPATEDGANSNGKVNDGEELPKQRGTSARKLNVETEIQVTSGANGGIYSVMGAFINEGDQVVCIEPFFDQYNAEIVFHGGTPVYVPLVPPTQDGGNNVESSDWKLDMDLLEKRLSNPATKAIILNTPHNPVGKVFSLRELQEIARLCIKYDILVVSDEVYDCLTFDGFQHVRIASLEGMWERTITVGSGGKSFACTGWRVGWLIGAPHLIGPARAVHTRITFAVNSLAQEGCAIGIERAPSQEFFETQIREYLDRREKLKSALETIGLPYTNPNGGYFIIADASSLKIPKNWVEEAAVPKEILQKPKDYLLAYFIAKTCDVVVIPATAFYSEGGAQKGENFVRFSFCKDGQLEEAAQRLRKLKPFLKT